MIRTVLSLLALGLLGCPKTVKEDDTGGPIGDDSDADTDVDTDTDTDCTTLVTGTEPLDAATAVYYRDPITVSFDGDGSHATITLTDASGGVPEYSTTWTDGNVQAELWPVLAADTTYTLTVSLCDSTTTSTFTTSSLGAPLEMDPSDLVGSTYVFRLSEATITEPAFLDFVASTYLTVPLLIMVDSADSSEIDMLGALGYHEDDGTYTQLTNEATWDFPAGDFTESPYFEAYSERIEITFDGTPIPIEQFSLSGTFSADGTMIEEGIGSGYGDSRYMGELVGRTAEDYSAVCDIAAGAGVKCVPCSDGEPYCLFIVAEEITAYLETGLVLSPNVDGDYWTIEEGDCDDTDASIHPNATETAGDGIDSDCDGADDT